MLSPTNSGLGLSFPLNTVRCYANIAFSKGDLAMFDTAQTVATSILQGESDSVFALVIKPAASNNYPWFCVAAEDVSAGKTGKFVVAGQVRALTNGAISKGDVLAAQAGQSYLDQAQFAGGDKAIAFALEAQTSGENLTWVIFSGVYPFGVGGS